MDSILVLDDIHLSFGETEVLRGISASVEAGRVTAFIGPNGAGKTTLFNVVNGYLLPNRGKVVFRGEDVTGIRPERLAGRGMGRQFQEVRVFGGLTVLDNVMAALLAESGQIPFWQRMIPDIGAGKMKGLRATALESLDYVGLAALHGRLARDLSFGQQKLLSLARLFARRFPCLLLDEPTAGLDPEKSRRFLALIRRAVNEQGLNVVAFVEHNMAAVEDLADWAHFLYEGRVVLSGTTDRILRDRAVRELYMGI